MNKKQVILLAGTAVSIAIGGVLLPWSKEAEREPDLSRPEPLNEEITAAPMRGAEPGTPGQSQTGNVSERGVEDRAEVDDEVVLAEEGANDEAVGMGIYGALPVVQIPSAIRGFLSRIGDQENLTPRDKARLEKLFKEWGEKDGEAALQTALSQFPAGDPRLDAAMAAFYGWAGRDVHSAADYIADLHTPQQDYLVYNAARYYGKVSGRNAARWALERVPPAYRNGATQHATLNWMESDAQEAVAWVESYEANEMKGQHAEKTMVWETVFGLSGVDLPAAMEMVGNFSQGDAIEVGVHAIADRWLDEEPVAANQWVVQMAQQYQNVDFDQVHALQALSAAERNATEARTWVQRIRNDETREQVSQALEYKIRTTRK